MTRRIGRSPSYKGHTEIAKQLLDKKDIDVNLQNKDGNTALILASDKGHTEIAKQLLDKKDIDVNLQSKDGNTALILASYKGHTEIAKQLLDKKDIDVNLQNENGDTALTLASSQGQIAQQLLARKDIDVNLQSKDGNTALILASYKGHTEIAKQLLDKKDINVNLQTIDGDTALTFASYKGHTEIAKQLLDKKDIDVNLQSKYGKTALILASYKGHTEIAELIASKKRYDFAIKSSTIAIGILTLYVVNEYRKLSKYQKEYEDLDSTNVNAWQNALRVLVELNSEDVDAQTIHDQIKESLNIVDPEVMSSIKDMISANNNDNFNNAHNNFTNLIESYGDDRKEALSCLGAALYQLNNSRLNYAQQALNIGKSVGVKDASPPPLLARLFLRNGEDRPSSTITRGQLQYIERDTSNAANQGEVRGR